MIGEHDYTYRLDHLRGFDGHRNSSLDMLDNMELLAAKNIEYKKRLYDWLVNGNTLLLRDVLADPFTVRHNMTTMKGKLAHFNAWACLDSVGMHSREAIAVCEALDDRPMTEEVLFTKGWRWDQHEGGVTLVDENDDLIVWETSTGIGCDKDDRKLIAAAPDLFAELKIHADCIEVIIEMLEDVDVPIVRELNERLPWLLERTLTAIEKVVGE